MLKKNILFLSLMLGVVLMIGCGQKTPYKVVVTEGTITWEGQPIPSGFSMEFFNKEEKGRPSYGMIDAEKPGKFTTIYTASIKGVQVGTNYLKFSWVTENQPVPEEFRGLIKKYGSNTPGYEIQIEKPNKKWVIDLKEAN